MRMAAHNLYTLPLHTGGAAAAAEMLMRQATMTAQLEEFVKELFIQLATKEEEARQLEAQLKKDRADFTAQAKQLSQHFQVAQHKSVALQTAHESLQVHMNPCTHAFVCTVLLQQAAPHADSHPNHHARRTRTHTRHPCCCSKS